MSSPEPFGEGGLFGSGPLADLMRNLARLLVHQGPLNWEIARQMAQWAAAGDQPEPNPDPLARVRLEELIRVAELHVSEATGLQVTSGGVLAAKVVTPSDWALRTLDAWKPLLEKLADRMAGAMPPPSVPEEEQQAADPMGRLFGNLPQMLGPFVFGLQAGSMVGQLANRAMGQYDLPMPRPRTDELLLVASTIDSFASDWSLPVDEVRMWVCLREATNHAVLGRGHVHDRLAELIEAYIGAFDPAGAALEDRLGSFDPTDMSALQEAFSDPEALLGEIQNDAQRQIQVPLRALLVAVVGYVDHMMDRVGRRLIASYGPLTEALRRRRLEDTPGTRILAKLCGVALDERAYEEGRAFVNGILERAGDDGLSRLWRSARELPTPAEIAAPGLWLARVDLDDAGT